MKIEQLKELNDSTTKKQLQQLVKEDKCNIDEFIRIQKFFEDVQIPFKKEYRNGYIDLMYKLSINGYVHTVNLIMDKLENEINGETFENIHSIVERIASDFDKGITYTNEFIDNLIDCTIANGQRYLSLFDLYKEAYLKEENLTKKIIKILSNKKFVTKRIGSARDFISILKSVDDLEEQATKDILSGYVDYLVQLITSEELLDKRLPEEHEYITQFFYIHALNTRQIFNLLKLSTSSKVIENRGFSEQLYLLDLYKGFINSYKEIPTTLNRLFVDDKIYLQLSFSFQIYLIKIVDRMEESNQFIELLDKLLIREAGNLEFEIKELIKEYTNYATTVEQIINESCDGESAIHVIASEAERENIKEFDSNTRLVLVPYKNIRERVDQIKKTLN